MEDKVGLNEYQYRTYPMGSGVNQEETMAIHYIQLSESRQSICGRNNPNSATVGGWDGVTCKNCLKLKPSMEQQDGLIGLPQDDKLREKITSIAVKIWHEEITVTDGVNQIHAAYKEAGYYQETAELIGRLLKRGWIPPEEAGSSMPKSRSGR